MKFQYSMLNIKQISVLELNASDDRWAYGHTIQTNRHMLNPDRFVKGKFKPDIPNITLFKFSMVTELHYIGGFLKNHFLALFRRIQMILRAKQQSYSCMQL